MYGTVITNIRLNKELNNLNDDNTVNNIVKNTYTNDNLEEFNDIVEEFNDYI